jgi:hypothetical protein
MNKRLFAIAIAMCIMVPALAAALGNVKAVSPTVLSLQPAVAPPLDIGKTFNLTLHVDNVTNLWSWKVQLTWDPAYLNMTSDPTEVSFLNNVNGTLFLYTPYAKTPGALNEASDTSLGSLGTSGSGDLATFTFKIIAHGYNTTAVNVTGAVMQDFIGPIAFSTVGANVTNTIPGDVNGDGVVNILDAIVLANHFGASIGQPNYVPGADINGDGTINILDAIILSNHFLQHL